MFRLLFSSSAALAFALAGCGQHDQTSTGSSAAGSPVPTAAPASVVGTWKLHGKPHVMGQYNPAVAGVTFKANGSGAWSTVTAFSMGPLVKRTQAFTWTDVGNGRLRLISGSSSGEFKDEFEGNGQLILTAVAGSVEGDGVVFDRIVK